MYDEEFERNSYLDMNQPKVDGIVFDIGNRYKNPRNLTDGGFGNVSYFFDNQMLKDVCIKKITLGRTIRKTGMALREIRIFSHLKHENIADLLRVILGFKEVYLVRSYMPYDLHEYLIFARRKEPVLCRILRQILLGVNYIHSVNVVHRDLKPANILVNEWNEVKICDFGLARSVSDEEDIDNLTVTIGTRGYQAPEILLRNNNYNKTVDIWSVGCILADMIDIKSSLFRGMGPEILIIDSILDVIGTPTEQEIIENVPDNESQHIMRRFLPRQKMDLHRKYPRASAEILDLLQRFLKFAPSDRITIEDALAHPFIASQFPFLDVLLDDVDNIPPLYINKEIDNLTEHVMEMMIVKEAVQFNEKRGEPSTQY